jgi:hypothetical protein
MLSIKRKTSTDDHPPTKRMHNPTSDTEVVIPQANADEDCGILRIPHDAIQHIYWHQHPQQNFNLSSLK